MEENSKSKSYFLVRTEREGVGEFWVLSGVKPEPISENNSPSAPIYIEFDPKVFKNGFPLTPDEVLRKGSARLQGILKESDFPLLNFPAGIPQKELKAYLEFLVHWGFPGGFIGGYEFYSQLADFLKGFLKVHFNSKVIVTGPKRALNILEQFLGNTEKVFLLAPNALETYIETELVSIVYILEADQVVSLSSPYFSALLNIPRRITLAQFNNRDFLRSSRREALSAIFGVSYYSAIWDYCLIDPNSLSFFEPKSYAWVSEQTSSVNFAEFVLEEEPHSQAISSGLAIPGEHAAKGKPSFFESAQLLAWEEEDKAEFVPFRKYYPTYADLSPAQLKWYLFWRSQARKGQFFPTDLSYIFLYVYELINNIGISDSLEGVRRLRELWLNYRGRYPRLDYYLVDWIADYIIVYKCPINFMEIYKEALKYGFIRNPDLLLEEFLKGPLEELPLILLEELSFYKFLKGPFFRKERDQALDLLVRRALVQVDNFLRVQDKGGIFEKFRPQTRIKVQRFPFQGAIFKDHDQMITLGTAFAYTRYPPLCNFFTSLIKEIENALREKFRFPGRLGGYDLPASLRKVIKETLREDVEKEPVPLIEVDAGKIKELLQESAEVQELVQKFISPEEIPESRVSSEEEIPESSSLQEPPQSLDGLEGLPPEWRLFASKLKPFHLKTLSVLLSGENVAAQITSISREYSLMPEAMVDLLNELSLETVGDLIVDCTVAPPVLFEENRPIINQILALIASNEYS